MRTVYRQVIPVDDQWHEVDMHGPVLHVGTRYEDAVELWYMHDTEQSETAHAFRIVGTGQALAPALAHYVGTAITPSGALVWHVWEHETLEGK